MQTWHAVVMAFGIGYGIAMLTNRLIFAAARARAYHEQVHRRLGDLEAEGSDEGVGFGIVTVQ